MKTGSPPLHKLGIPLSMMNPETVHILVRTHVVIMAVAGLIVAIAVAVSVSRKLRTAIQITPWNWLVTVASCALGIGFLAAFAYHVTSDPLPYVSGNGVAMPDRLPLSLQGVYLAVAGILALAASLVPFIWPLLALRQKKTQ